MAGNTQLIAGNTQLVAGNIQLIARSIQMIAWTIQMTSRKDDIVLAARTAQGVRVLLAVVKVYCDDLRMTISSGKSKVLSKVSDL